MDQNFQTSFIPKKPMIEEHSSTASPHSVSFLLIISLFVFFTVSIAAGGLYFYQGILNKNIASMQNTLVLAENRFEPSKITELQTLDKRLNAANEILSNHIAISPIFETLQAVTMKTVRYTKFSYSISDDKIPKITIDMSGQAVGYLSIALQADLFSQNKNLIDPVFSNLSLDDKGNVLFDLEFSVDPSFVNYNQVLATETGTAQSTSTPSTGN
jgi:hypothetical protein